MRAPTTALGLALLILINGTFMHVLPFILNLISDILDLSKIESGTVTVEAEEIQLKNLLSTVERTFLHEAENRNLSFDLYLDPSFFPNRSAGKPGPARASAHR